MAISCTAADLLAASKCLCGIPSGKRELVMIYLLQQIAGLENLTAAQLLDRAKCLCGLSPRDMKAIEVALLCTATGGVPPCPPSGGVGSCASLTGDVPPTGNITPGFVGQLYIRNPGPLAQYFYSTGTTSADWTQIPSYQDMQVAWTPTNLKLGEKVGYAASSSAVPLDGIFTLEFLHTRNDEGYSIGGGANTLQSVSFPNLVNIGNNGFGSAFGVNFSTCSSLVSFSAPVLQTIFGTNGIYLNSDPVLTSINLDSLVTLQSGDLDFDASAVVNVAFPALVTVGRVLDFDSCPSLVSALFPSLTTVANNFIAHTCPSLTTVTLPQWVPTDGTTIRFDGDALNVTSVQQILRRLVLAGVTTCTINLSGGTNSGTLALNAQGQADVATLGAQLTMNP